MGARSTRSKTPSTLPEVLQVLQRQQRELAAATGEQQHRYLVKVKQKRAGTHKTEFDPTAGTVKDPDGSQRTTCHVQASPEDSPQKGESDSDSDGSDRDSFLNELMQVKGIEMWGFDIACMAYMGFDVYGFGVWRVTRMACGVKAIEMQGFDMADVSSENWPDSDPPSHRWSCPGKFKRPKRFYPKDPFKKVLLSFPGPLNSSARKEKSGEKESCGKILDDRLSEPGSPRGKDRITLEPSFSGMARHRSNSLRQMLLNQRMPGLRSRPQSVGDLT
eukprot:gene561-1971_t